MLEELEELSAHTVTSLKKMVVSDGISKGEFSITVRLEHLREALLFLKDDPQCTFKQLIDICGVDYPDREERFEVVYQLLSLEHNQRIRIKVMTGEETAVDSVSDIYSTAGWFEREVWDMYGVFFNSHPDLRRILTDYGFEGHPQRKDFPLTGFVETRYDKKLERVVYEPVQLTQDYRNFDYTSPWEGMEDVQLPGDEKACNPMAAPAPKPELQEGEG